MVYIWVTAIENEWPLSQNVKIQFSGSNSNKKQLKNQSFGRFPKMAQNTKYYFLYTWPTASRRVKLTHKDKDSGRSS